MEDSRNFYIVAEVVTGGDLLKKIITLKHFTEQQACSVIKQLLLALNFMH
jgi:serine/threonine protein kinase